MIIDIMIVRLYSIIVCVYVLFVFIFALGLVVQGDVLFLVQDQVYDLCLKRFFIIYGCYYFVGVLEYGYFEISCFSVCSLVLQYFREIRRCFEMAVKYSNEDLYSLVVVLKERAFVIFDCVDDYFLY